MTTQKILRRVWERRHLLIVIGLINLIYAFSYFQRIAIPGTIFNEVQKDLSLSSTEVALLGSIFLYIYSGMQLFNGLLVDKFGSIKVIIIGGILLGIGSVIFPLSQTVGMLYFSRAIVGFGASVMFSCLVKELDLQFSDSNFSMAFSISLLFVYMGGLLGTKPFAGAVASYGWRHSLLAIGIACCVVVAIAYLFLKKSMKRPMQYPTVMLFSALKKVVLNPLIYPPVFSSSVVYATYYVMQSVIGKKFLEDSCNISSTKSATYTFIMMLASILSAFVIGFIPKLIEDRRKPVMIVINIFSILAVIMAFFIAYGNTKLIIPCFILWGISASGSPVFLSSIKELNEPDCVGVSSGFYNMCVYMLLAVMVTSVGLVMDMFAKQAIKTATAIHYPPQAYTTFFIGALILTVISFIVTFLVRETAGKNINLLIETDNLQSSLK